MPDVPAEATGMVWIPGGTFTMGSNDFYPEERPARRVSVGGFWIDRFPVTVAEFSDFVRATGYVTVAEQVPLSSEYPHVDPEVLVPGSLVFTRPRGRVSLDDPRLWWSFVAGACWRHPEGPGSDVSARARHPVSHVTLADALAFAAYRGRALPTEAEWEYASRGGGDSTRYAWGDQLFPGGRAMANTWQGEFPWQNLRIDGYEGTSPVDAFPPNGYGLHDMIGNVWEWTADEFGPPGPDGGFPRHVVKGGSHLSAPNYSLHYRPPARRAQSADTSSTELGFRCVVRP